MPDRIYIYAPLLPLDEKNREKLGLSDMPPPPQTTQSERKNEDLLPSSKPVINTQQNKTEQEALRYVLGQLMIEVSEKIDEIPENMGLAEQEMRGAEDALGDNNPNSAIPHQEKALEHLKEAQEQLNKQFQQRMKQMMRLGFGGMKLDPLGRPYDSEGDQSGKNNGEKIEIPDESKQKRVEEILRILRERSGELDRPPEERQYFHRLLRQF